MKKVLFLLFILLSFGLSQGILESINSESVNSKSSGMDELCDNGDASICYALGKMNERNSALLQNKNTPESRMYYKKASNIYKMECDEDNFTSCSILGNMHINSQGVDNDHFKAKEYFTKACDNDEQEGCVGIGKLHLSGVSARKDGKMAKKYFESACEKKNQNGCLFLAQMYEKGEGISKNKKQAKEYYGKACDFNSQAGCAKYSELSK